MTLTYWQQNRPTLSNTRLGHPPSFWWPWPTGNGTDLRSPTPGWVTHLHSDDPDLLATEQTYTLQHQAGSPTFILMTLTYWQQNRPTLSNTRLGHPPSFWWPWPTGNGTDLRSPTPGWVTHLHSDDPDLLATEQTYTLQHQAGSPTFILMALTYWQQNRPTLSNTRLGHLTFILMTLTYWQQNRPTLSNTRLGHPPSFWWPWPIGNRTDLCSPTPGWVTHLHSDDLTLEAVHGHNDLSGIDRGVRVLVAVQQRQKIKYNHKGSTWACVLRSTAGVIMRLNHRVIVRSQSRAMIATRTKHRVIVTLLFDFQWGQTVWSHHHPSV